MDRPFVMLFAVVSGLAALAIALVRHGGTGDTIAGSAIGLVALAGIITLARIVIAAERGKQERS